MTISLVNPNLSASLSAAESAELAARLRTLAESGLALEGGLRALAEEVGNSRLAEVLDKLAARLECGEPLAQAIDSADCRLPVVLRGLILAGVQSGRLPEVLEQFAALDRRRKNSAIAVSLTFAYPALLLNTMAVLLVLFRFYVVDEFRKLFMDFGMKLPALTQFYLDYAGIVGWTVRTCACRAGRLHCLAAAVGKLPGPVRGLDSDYWPCRLQRALFPIYATDGHAARCTGAAARRLETRRVSHGGSLLERQCRMATADVQAGIPLDEALGGAVSR